MKGDIDREFAQNRKVVAVTVNCFLFVLMSLRLTTSPSDAATKEAARQRRRGGGRFGLPYYPMHARGDVDCRQKLRQRAHARS